MRWDSARSDGGEEVVAAAWRACGGLRWALVGRLAQIQAQRRQFVLRTDTVVITLGQGVLPSNSPNRKGRGSTVKHLGGPPSTQCVTTTTTMTALHPHHSKMYNIYLCVCMCMCVRTIFLFHGVYPKIFVINFTTDIIIILSLYNHHTPDIA